MVLNKINLVNFRNYYNSTITLSDKMNIILGDNAQGKTNILEAIIILALTKSHRIGITPNIINFTKKKSTISGIVKKDKIVSKLEIKITEDTKEVKVNNKKIKKISDYISYLNVIVFTPEDLDIIKGSPNIRRNLLNIELSQISNKYITYYNEYNKLLKIRNEYLKLLFNNNIADKSYLDIITDKLIEKAIYIYQNRKEYIDLINKSIDNYYNNINEDKGLKIKYIPNIEISEYSNEIIKKEMKRIFSKNYQKELNYGMTLYGPHRDDFCFLYKDQDLKYYGSQGQQKTAVLAFKIAEIPIFKEKNKTNPVLLLDDIFSELDIKKRNNLLNTINKEDTQIIITTTDLKNINKKHIENSKIFYIENGIIKRK